MRRRRTPRQRYHAAVLCAKRRAMRSGRARRDVRRTWWFDRPQAELKTGEVAKPARSQRKRATGDEDFSAEAVYPVEFADLRTQFWTWKYGEAVGTDEFGNSYYRTCGGKIDPTLRLRAALGNLQRLCRAVDGAAVLARLAAPHRGCAADAGNLPGARLAEAAPPQHDRDAGRLPAAGLDARLRPPPQGDRRLQGLEPQSALIGCAAPAARGVAALPPPHSPC